jgi:hypothetical protein
MRKQRSWFAGSLMLAKVLLLATLMALAPATDARTPRHASKTASQAVPDESQLVEHGRYTNKSGESVHSPAHTKDGKAPSGASAQCRDGSYSFSRSHSGTCSRHGGVAAWL